LQSNEELRNTNGCYLVTQFSSNPTNRFILSELSFLAKVTEKNRVCKISAKYPQTRYFIHSSSTSAERFYPKLRHTLRFRAVTLAGARQRKSKKDFFEIRK